MRHKGGHSWGWEVWWGWVSQRRPFKVILHGTHPMGPKSPGSRASCYIENMHGKPRRWYTVWSGKVSKMHLLSHLLVVGFAIPAALLTVSPLGESAPFPPLFRTGCNLSWRWTGRRGTNERLALGVGTGSGHSIFPSGRRINHRLNLPPGTRIGPEESLHFCGQLPKNELKNGAQGHCNSQNCRVINDNSRPQIYWGKATKRIWK